MRWLACRRWVPCSYPPDGSLAGLPDRVTHRALTRASGSEGAALLAAAMDTGASRRAIGAYRSGRMLEWMLGGVTEPVLHHATLPLLVHWPAALATAKMADFSQILL